MTWMIHWRRPDSGEVQEAKSIMREAFRGDIETLIRVADALRSPSQGYSTKTQVEVDGVIAQWMARHPERRGGAPMTGPNGPIGPGPR